MLARMLMLPAVMSASGSLTGDESCTSPILEGERITDFGVGRRVGCGVELRQGYRLDGVRDQCGGQQCSLSAK